jgi:hypothetical protein
VLFPEIFIEKQPVVDDTELADPTSRGRTLREYVASDGNGLQNLIAIISELRRSAGAACGRPVQTYCPIGPRAHTDGDGAGQVTT